MPHPHLQIEPARGAAESASSRQPPRELLTAWLLLLLGREANHGYELRRLLEENGLVTDPAAMYRVLRKLEREGRAESFWGKSIAGPRRRLYRLTDKGLTDLDALVGAIRITCESHAAFLDAHESHFRQADSHRDGVTHQLTCDCSLLQSA